LHTDRITDKPNRSHNLRLGGVITIIIIINLGMCAIDFLLRFGFCSVLKKSDSVRNVLVRFGSVQKNAVPFGYYS